MNPDNVCGRLHEIYGGVKMIRNDNSQLVVCPHCQPEMLTAPVDKYCQGCKGGETASPDGKQEKQCPDAPKKPATARREGLVPIPISPALRFDAPVLDWCNDCGIRCSADPRRIFCSKCGNGLVARPRFNPREHSCFVCETDLKLEDGDRFCMHCGSSVNAAISNYPIASVEFEKPAEHDVVMNARVRNWSTRVVLLKGSKMVGVCAPTDIMHCWDECEWKMRPVGAPVGAPVGTEWTEVRPKLVIVRDQRVIIYMK